MTKKPITIKSISKLKPLPKSSLPDEIADKWVEEFEPQAVAPKKPIEEIRFTIVIPSYLHKRIKKYCVNNTISMKDKLTQLFTDNFPE